MPHTLLVFNPSKYERGGWVTLPWAPIAKETGFGQNELVLYQDAGTPLFYQVDQIDPTDPSRDALSFFLSRPIKPGDEHYRKPTGKVFIQGKTSSDKERREPPEQKRDYELSNKQLDVRLHLTPESEDHKGYWYAGSARSIRLEKLRAVEDGVGERKEFLDYFSDFYLSHDPQKRCVQLDSIRLSHLDPRLKTYQQIYLHNQPYRLVSECGGPVRKCVTIASRPFYYNYSPPAAFGAIPLRCELYRVFSLYEDREYVLEELFVKVKPPETYTGDDDFNLFFEAHYFTYMTLGQPRLCQYESVPDWFAMGDLDSSLVYGFACDVHVSSIAHPDPTFPDLDVKENSFSWNLCPCKAATCLHLFSKFQPTSLPSGPNLLGNLGEMSKRTVQWFESQAGHAWYEIIYKPLYARLAAPGDDISQGGEYVV
jgi:hypothetical protein